LKSGGRYKCFEAVRASTVGACQPFIANDAAGHNNVFYVGDRVRLAGQLNGKSANLNHVICTKIYPGVKRADQIPKKDILMVMDCDHMAKPEMFNKMGPCMRDLNVGVCLAPQWFHNLVYPGMLPCLSSLSSPLQCGLSVFGDHSTP
jgi:hypothetical protein